MCAAHYRRISKANRKVLRSVRATSCTCSPTAQATLHVQQPQPKMPCTCNPSGLHEQQPQPKSVARATRAGCTCSTPQVARATMLLHVQLPQLEKTTKRAAVSTLSGRSVARFHICILLGDASLILIPKRLLIRRPATSVCEQTGWAKIDAARN